tara:strand:+ start:16442 stop:17386 length:945 start_codon:yes stop_codon:yes gene_type:complete
MFDEISTVLYNSLDRLPTLDNIETEARLGRFLPNGTFYPGVSEKYFNDMLSVLRRFVQPQQLQSIAIYFTDGLRSEVFAGSGRVESMQKRKVIDDIDMNPDNHYALRISGSHEKPVHSTLLESQVRKFIKPKSIPKLLREGTVFELYPNATVYHKKKPHKVSRGFGKLMWKPAHPDYVITLSRRKIKFRDTEYKKDQWVEMLNMAGVMGDKAVPIGRFSILAHIQQIKPLCVFSNVSATPPYLPTAWRSKKRQSFQLWEGLTIDMTETVYSNQSIQQCYDGRGTKTYEVEADWDGISKGVKEFSEVIKHVLYSK